MLNVAMLSKWHVHAEGYAKALIDTGRVNVSAIWDEDAERGSAWASSIGAEFIGDYEQLLSCREIDAVICCSPTSMHERLLIPAAKAGKHIFTEKALATTVRGCLEIGEAVKESGVTFTISYPHTGTPVIIFARKLMNQGIFGDVKTVRFRNGHSGVSAGWLPPYWFSEKDAGGGAMMDLGCHPMYVLSCLCGHPSRISAIFDTPKGGRMDDNAVAVIGFENGIIGISETSFVSASSPDTLEIYGTAGTLFSRGGEINVFSTLDPAYSGGFTAVTPNESMPLPIIRFADACINGSGSPEGLGIDEAVALTELLENAYISNEENRTVTVTR